MPRRKRDVAAELEVQHLPLDAENPESGDLGPVRNDAIHSLAVEYARAKRAKEDAARAEKNAHERLYLALVIAGLDRYEYGGVSVRIENSPKVKATVGWVPGEEE